MTIEAKTVLDRMDTHPIIGKRLVRIVEMTGATNTQGEPEVYRARLDGFYSDGSLRFDALVQRTNGSFSMLNGNVHRYRVAAVRECLRVSGALDQYTKDNMAAA